ncbi:MAG TPA: TrbI/VirB10 family protein [Thermoanaerobaculia bacterium]|nr:TrbI/VirB10 family protein [Thermoanaerobaculia bacterium]
MRNVRFQPFLLALLLGLSAFGMGCRQSEEPESGQVAIEQDEQDRETNQAENEPGLVGDDPELQPEQRIVVVEPETGEDAGARQDLDERERRLAERNAELDARERQLREQDAAERQARLRAREREQEQAREPEPERQAQAPKPAPPAKPVPQVEREEPVETEEVAESRRDEEAESEAAELEQERQAREREERDARDRRGREEQARRDREREEEEREREEEARLPAPLVVNVPAGTVMEVEILEGLSSQTSEPGDIFRARVASDVSSDGAVGIPAGSEIVGVVTEAVPLGKVGGQARLGLKFTDLVLPNGRTVPIDASLVQQGSNETRRDAATIGGAAAGGAILGRVLSKKDRSKGTVIGAIIGAAAGAVLASRNGEEVVIPEGTKVDLKLDDELEVRARGR